MPTLEDYRGRDPSTLTDEELRSIDLSAYELDRDPNEPGFSPEDPLQEQHPDADRARLMIKNLATSPSGAKTVLEAQGFLVEPTGDGLNFALRKPSERYWRVLDPVGFDLADLTDELSLLPSAAAEVAGGIGGAALGVAGGPAGVVAGGAGGAAAGAGAVAAVREAISERLGLAAPGAGARIGLEAGLAGAIPIAGAGVMKAARGLRRAPTPEFVPRQAAQSAPLAGPDVGLAPGTSLGLDLDPGALPRGVGDLPAAPPRGAEGRAGLGLEAGPNPGAVEDLPGAPFRRPDVGLGGEGGLDLGLGGSPIPRGAGDLPIGSRLRAQDALEEGMASELQRPAGTRRSAALVNREKESVQRFLRENPGLPEEEIAPYIQLLSELEDELRVARTTTSSRRGAVYPKIERPSPERPRSMTPGERVRQELELGPQARAAEREEFDRSLRSYLEAEAPRPEPGAPQTTTRELRRPKPPPAGREAVLPGSPARGGGGGGGVATATQAMPRATKRAARFVKLAPPMQRKTLEEWLNQQGLRSSQATSLTFETVGRRGRPPEVVTRRVVREPMARSVAKLGDLDSASEVREALEQWGLSPPEGLTRAELRQFAKNNEAAAPIKQPQDPSKLSAKLKAKGHVRVWDVEKGGWAQVVAPRVKRLELGSGEIVDLDLARAPQAAAQARDPLLTPDVEPRAGFGPEAGDPPPIAAAKRDPETTFQLSQVIQQRAEGIAPSSKQLALLERLGFSGPDDPLLDFAALYGGPGERPFRMPKGPNPDPRVLGQPGPRFRGGAPDSPRLAGGAESLPEGPFDPDPSVLGRERRTGGRDMSGGGAVSGALGRFADFAEGRARRSTTWNMGREKFSGNLGQGKAQATVGRVAWRSASELSRLLAKHPELFRPANWAGVLPNRLMRPLVEAQALLARGDRQGYNAIMYVWISKPEVRRYLRGEEERER